MIKFILLGQWAPLPLYGIRRDLNVSIIQKSSLESVCQTLVSLAINTLNLCLIPID